MVNHDLGTRSTERSKLLELLRVLRSENEDEDKNRSPQPTKISPHLKLLALTLTIFWLS